MPTTALPFHPVRPLRAFLISLLALALAASLVVTPSARASSWLDEDFESGASGVFDSGWGIESTTSNGHVGRGLVSKIPRGEHWGSSAWWETDTHLGSEPEEMWLRYYLRFPEGFRVDSPSRGKLPGLAGLYSGRCRGGDPSTTSAPCWSARMMFSPLYVNDGLPSYPYDADKVTRIGFYPYLLSSSGAGKAGEVMPWDADIATLQHGRWYCVEARVKMNTPGQADGILEGFVDGRRGFHKDDAIFRRASEPQLKVESVWFDVYYGGEATSPVDNEIHFDSLAAGADRIGCNDAEGYEGTFADDDTSVFASDIERLAASGVTKGCNPPLNDRFCPTDPVTRGQMAAFLHRALEGRLDTAVPPEPDSPPDLWGVRSGSHYSDALDAFAAAGAPLDTVVVTYPIDDTSAANDWLSSSISGPRHWVPMQLGNIAAAGATPYVQLIVSDLDGLAAGAFDARLEAMTGAFAEFLGDNPGAELFVDILPEANRREKGYGDDPTRFRAAFRRVSSTMRAALDPSRLRVVYSGNAAMSSDRYSIHDWLPGAPELYWPGGDHADIAGLRGRPSSADTTASSEFATAFSALASTAGPSVPLVLGPVSVPDAPSTAAQLEFLSSAVDFVSAHPQAAGLIWDDVQASGSDFRLLEGSVTSGVASAVAPLDAPADWLFSPSAATWRSARRSLPSFGDTASSVFADDIVWLARADVTRGCNPPDNTRFCPDSNVTRGQMAAFLTRALSLPKGGSTFSDTRGHVFEADVAALADAGITRGCNPPANDRFCPDAAVTRGQMAAFLVRAGLTD